MLQAGGCEGMSCGDRHCPGARKPLSARFVVSWYEDSTLDGLEERDNIHTVCNNYMYLA